MAARDPDESDFKGAPAAAPPRRGPSHQYLAGTLRAAQQGSDVAFESLYCQFVDHVWRYARVRRAQDPDAAVNDVFLRIRDRIDTFSGSEIDFVTWVFSIARAVLVDRERGEGLSPSVAGGTPEDLALESLVARLDVLSADQKDVVLLRVLTDLPVDAVAEILDKRPRAITVLQRRAFATLADHLDKQLVGAS